MVVASDTAVTDEVTATGDAPSAMAPVRKVCIKTAAFRHYWISIALCEFSQFNV